jgi:hypothetical protein
VAVIDEGCPDRAQVEEALSRQGLVSVAEGAPFQLEVRGEGSLLRVRLQERAGAVLLERTLPADECAPLAETIAVLVERRLDGVAWHAPAVDPPVPPRAPTPRAAERAPPRAAVTGRVRSRASWSLDLAVGGLWATGVREDVGQPGGVLALRLRPPAPIGIRLSVATLSRAVVPVASGSFEIVRTPFALGAGWSSRWSGVELDLELRAELELLATESRGIAQPRADTSLALRGGPAATLGLRLVPHAWLVLDAALLPVLSGWQFVVHRVDDPSVTVRVASQVTAVELGLAVLWRFGASPN